MTKRKGVIYSQVDYPDRCEERHILRVLFLYVVVDLKRDALTDLFNEPFNIYRKLMPGLNSTDIFDIINESPLVHELIESIKRWGATHHLNAEWCYRVAVETLRARRHNPDKATEFATLESGGKQYEHEMPEGFSPYIVTSEPREIYLLGERKRVLQRIKNDPLLRCVSISLYPVDKIMEVLEKACEEAENKALALGYKLPKERRKLQQFLRWAVLAQVCEKSFKGIAYAEEKAVEISTVSRAVKEILNFIGLNPRKELQRNNRRTK